MKRDIELHRIDKEALSPKKFLKLNQKEKSNISYLEIIPARLGRSDFGKIMVHYRTPIYK